MTVPAIMGRAPSPAPPRDVRWPTPNDQRDGCALCGRGLADGCWVNVDSGDGSRVERVCDECWGAAQ